MPTPKKTRGRRGILNDIIWVYENVNSSASPPSDGAEELLKLAKEDWDGFVSKYVRKILPSANVLDKWDQQGEDAAKPHHEKLDRLIEEFEREQAKNA